MQVSIEYASASYYNPLLAPPPSDTGIARSRLIYGRAIFYTFRRNNTIALSSRALARNKLANKHKNSTNLVPLAWIV